MSSKRLTEQQIATATRLRALGWSYARIADNIGCHPESLRRHCDTAFKEKPSRAERAPTPFRRSFANQHSATRDAIEARLAEIPEDTRSLTGRICGDPLPGRSALDRRGA